MSDAGSTSLSTQNSTSGYAASVSSVSLGGSKGLLGLLGSATYGYGIWFSVAAGASGPLFSAGSSPSNGGAETYDRTLSISNGALTFSIGGNSASTPALSDGWHFAFVRVVASRGLLGASTKVTIYVDGSNKAAAYKSVSSNLGSSSGYWHIGYAGSAYLTGSLSDFVVFGGGNNDLEIPTTSNVASQSAFDSWVLSNSSDATDYWRLNDSGTTTYGGTLPGGMATPCSQVNVSLAFADPSDTSIASMPLSTFANNTPRTVAAPSPGQTQAQALTITLARGGSVTYSPDISGLHLYVPIVFSVAVAVAASTNWKQTFTWAGDPTDVFIS